MSAAVAQMIGTANVQQVIDGLTPAGESTKVEAGEYGVISEDGKSLTLSTVYGPVVVSRDDVTLS